ncbi:hypothetical protein [Tenacibaculum aiptasiae]|uniref:hypothetical protein n=1 Tax=Tenacibaculum aiptasiae TaxID=426481 RepID=UPI003B58FFDD
MKLKMQANNIDKNIKDKLKNRELKPSASAWERLSIQLDQEKARKKKKRIQLLSYAASVILLVSIGILYLGTKSDNQHIIPINETIVETPLDTFKINEVNIKEEVVDEKAIANLVDEDLKKKEVSKKVKKESIKKSRVLKENFIANTVIEKELKEVKTLPNIDKSITKEREKSTPQQKVKSRIKINSDYLLYAVTHSPEEVKEYYAKYEINREDVLDVIQDELIKSNLKINPETILAEVELSIQESDFKQDFMSKLKLKLSDVIVAIADRNK